MIFIKNTQRKIKINVKQLKKITEKILKIIKYSDYDLGIWITNSKNIRKYNLKYRNKDKTTDILSFSFHEIIPGERIDLEKNNEKILGDIIISAEYVYDEFKNNFDKRIVKLIVHGICHLIGYTHENDIKYKQMKRKESLILKNLNLEDL